MAVINVTTSSMATSDRTRTGRSVSPKATAYRLVLSVSAGNGPRVPAYVDAVILQQGRIQTALVFTSIGQPVGEVDRVALASVVAARMAKANRPNGPVA